MNYLLDANIFIEAKRRYYGMDSEAQTVKASKRTVSN
jgi:hypothetical protein